MNHSETAGTNDDKFYDQLIAFNEFSEITQSHHYAQVPENWWVFVADIKGSTQAIEAGRYRDVNMVGAACIAGVLNAVHPFQIPYVFGGDGATLVGPDFLKEKIVHALRGVQKRSTEKFSLELRVGSVAVKNLKKYGVQLEIAKHQMADKVELAMFRGGGLAKAEELVKSKASDAELILPQSEANEPVLDGLSCRWSAFRSTHGSILSIIMKVRAGTDSSVAIYSTIIATIEKILQNPLAVHNPISANQLKKMGMTLNGIKTEWSLVTSAEQKWKSAVGVFLRAFVSKIIIRFNIYFGPFVAEKYKREMLSRCDHKKFDDTLRLVLDCSPSQKLAIEQYLEQLFQDNKIDYGIHTSETALMTCYVPGATDGSHIHFIDGNNGGYALAAKAMKSRRQLAT